MTRGHRKSCHLFQTWSHGKSKHGSQCVQPAMSWVYFAPSDVSCGNPQKQVCSFCLVNNTKWRFYFLPHLWPRKVNHTLQKSTELRLPECKVLTCCAMSLKLILPWGTKAGQLVPRDDLARHLLYVLQWCCKSPEKTLGRKHQRIAMGRVKTLSKKPIKERKRAQKVCSLLYWSWLFCFKSRLLSWFFCYNICGCSQARSAYSHSEDLILVFISVFWVTTLFKQTTTSTSLPQICFLLLKLVPWPVSLPFPLTRFVIASGSKIYDDFYFLLPEPPVSVTIGKSDQPDLPIAACQSGLFTPPSFDQLLSRSSHPSYV